MPAQTAATNGAYYTQGDTWPPITAVLTDNTGATVDLTGATVTIRVAYARWSYYYSPTQLIVTDASCVVHPDQTNYQGQVQWTPSAGDTDIAGDFKYTFEVTFPGGGVQTFPQNTQLPLHIETKLPGA